MQASIVGLPADAIEDLTGPALQEKIDTLMTAPVLYAPIPSIPLDPVASANTWSEGRNAEVYPENALFCLKVREQTVMVERAILSGNLDESERKFNTMHMLSDLKLLTSENIEGTHLLGLQLFLWVCFFLFYVLTVCLLFSSRMATSIRPGPEGSGGRHAVIQQRNG